jgi:hypothetical protein
LFIFSPTRKIPTIYHVSHPRDKPMRSHGRLNNSKSDWLKYFLEIRR